MLDNQVLKHEYKNGLPKQQQVCKTLNRSVGFQDYVKQQYEFSKEQSQGERYPSISFSTNYEMTENMLNNYEENINPKKNKKQRMKHARICMEEQAKKSDKFQSKKKVLKSGKRTNLVTNIVLVDASVNPSPNPLEKQQASAKQIMLLQRQHPQVQKMLEKQQKMDIQRNQEQMYQTIESYANNTNLDKTNSRKGKTIQSKAQKSIKKLTGYHYSKNWKQNREKMIKKMLKKGMQVTYENYCLVLEEKKTKTLTINKRFLKNTSSTAKDYQSYHRSFKSPSERQFVEDFLFPTLMVELFKIMFRSDMRTGRVEEVVFEMKSKTEQKLPSASPPVRTTKVAQPILSNNQQSSYGQKSNKLQRKDPEHCLDSKGKDELQQVFDRVFSQAYQDFVIKQKIKPTETMDYEQFKEHVIRFVNN